MKLKKILPIIVLAALLIFALLPGEQTPDVGIIGGADGPTAIFVTTPTDSPSDDTAAASAEFDKAQIREDGREVKLPTAAGMELGISQEVRSGANGSYTVVVYNENAQRYIVDNIDAILEAEKLRFKMQGMPWSQAEDEFLEEQAARGIPVYDIALALKRNISSVRARTKKLGLIVSK